MEKQLPKKPDSNIMRLLTRAKLFLDHAVMHSKTNAAFDRMIAIHNLDNYVEYILRIIIRHIEIEEITGKNLETSEIAQLASEVNKFLKERYSIELPYVAEIKLLRQVRNLVQHAMVDPAADLPRLITVCQRFFDKTLKSIFGMTPYEIRVSSMIEDEVIKKQLKNAEEFIDNKKYLEAVVACRDAFENAKFKKMENSPLKTNLVPAILEAKKNLKYLYNYLKSSNLELEIEKQGIEYRLYQRFDDYIKHIPYEFCSDWHSNTVMQRPWNIDDALFCYSFVSDIIYKWENSTYKPLYEVEVNNHNLSWKEFIGEVELKRVCDGGCEYCMAEDEYMKYIFVDEETNKNILKTISDNKVYELISETYSYENIQFRSHEYIEILAIDSNLVTNNPARWEVLIWMKKLPLTYYSENLKEGKWISEYLDISKADFNELSKFGLPKSIVEVILYPKNNALCMSNLKHAKQISDMLREDSSQFNRNIYFGDLIYDIKRGEI